MNVGRILWAGLASLLLPLFSPAGASSAPVPQIPENGVLRYFHYWAEYGEDASRPGGLERIRYEIQPKQLYFSQGRPRPDSFQCQTDGSLNRELVPVLAALDLADWPGQMEQSDLFDLSEKKKSRLCRWHISATFEPEKPGAHPFQFSFYGADDGTSPKRIAAEQAFRSFFGPKLDELKAATPRRLTGLLWVGDGSSYNFDVEDNGIATLKIRKGGERVGMAVYPGLAHELEALVRFSALEKHHGFLERMDDRLTQSLSISFDTSQRIEVTGHNGPGGLPKGFGEALAPLLKVMDKALSPPVVTKALPPTALSSLSFRVSGMVIGEDIQLYERMDKDGPCLVLSRNVGHLPDSRREAVLNAALAAELETLLEKNAVRAWNGFKGRPCMEVLDGEGFSFSLAFRDGTKVEASGENKLPAGYADFRRGLNSFADRVLGVQE